MFEVVRKLSIEDQVKLVELCRDVVRQAPLFRKVMPTGAEFRYLCTSAGQYGWISDRKGYRYVDTHPITEKPFPDIPELVCRVAIDAAQSCGESVRPETALINYYTVGDMLGIHQDKTEESLAPVVSISLGDDCIFSMGGLNRSDPKQNLTLHSGDVLVMGGEHRLCFHAVKKIIPATAPPELGMKDHGRINITVRQVYN